MGDPQEVLWFAEGRPATRAEVLESLEDEVAVLRERTVQETPPALQPEELAAIDAAHQVALRLLPA
jgi:hypothetical protein